MQNFSIKKLDGSELNMDQFNGKVVMLVNVASKCALTPHYKELQSLYDKYKDQGFEIIGFPCNQFGSQEPGTAEEIQNFCSTNYGVTFTLTEKIDVKGPDQHPIFKWAIDTNPVSNDENDCMRWNFVKFLVDKNGKVVDKLLPKDSPNTAEDRIVKLLS